MRRNHKLESELAEKIVGYVLVNTDDYFAAEKELAQHTTNTQSAPCTTCDGSGMSIVWWNFCANCGRKLH
jgi:hypothetical protein